MLIDPNELDEIVVGGDDLTMKNTKTKRFNFHGTQHLGLGPQADAFGTKHQKLSIHYGISPKSKKDDA